MKILVVFTGGTIGSSVNGEIISPDTQKKSLLIKLYNEKRKHNIEFKTVEPYYTLSENNTGLTVTKLISAVCDEIQNNYSGIIVAHGTDTLQYSAAALSYALGSRCIPVMLVSSNYVLNDSRANGPDNFAAAVDFIKGGYGKGVFVPYRNSDGKVYVHRASRLLQHNEFSDDIFSIKNHYFGSYIGDTFIKNPHFKAEKDAVLPFSKAELSEFSKQIKVIQAYAGCDYPAVDENIRAVLIKAYHSGTICTDNSSFKYFAETCRQKKIPCYICGAENRDVYESAKMFAEYGFTVLPPASFISQYVKLWMALSVNIDFESIYRKSLGEDILP